MVETRPPMTGSRLVQGVSRLLHRPSSVADVREGQRSLCCILGINRVILSRCESMWDIQYQGFYLFITVSCTKGRSVGDYTGAGPLNRSRLARSGSHFISLCHFVWPRDFYMDCRLLRIICGFILSVTCYKKMNVVCLGLLIVGDVSQAVQC